MDPKLYTDSPIEIILAVVLAISAFITFKLFLERQAIRKGGHTPTRGGGLWPLLAIISGVALYLVNR